VVLTESANRTASEQIVALTMMYFFDIPTSQTVSAAKGQSFYTQ